MAAYECSGNSDEMEGLKMWKRMQQLLFLMLIPGSLASACVDVLTLERGRELVPRVDRYIVAVFQMFHILHTKVECWYISFECDVNVVTK